MADVTLTLKPEQARALRAQLLMTNYASAAENLVSSIGDIAAVIDAREHLESVTALVEQFGWPDDPTGPVTVTVDQEALWCAAHDGLEAASDRVRCATFRADVARDDRRGLDLKEARRYVDEAFAHVEVLAQLERVGG